MSKIMSRITMLAGLLAGLTWAQTGAIEGNVKGPDGKPLAGAWIRIERTDIKGEYLCDSKKKGDFFHAGLPLGTYNVYLYTGASKVKGKLEGGELVDQVKNVRTRLGDPVPVNFDLAERANRQAAVQKAAETGTVTAEVARDMSPEQKAALEKAMKERSASMAKNKDLNDAFNGGMEALKTQNYPTAVEQFTKASVMDPKQHVIWAQLAESHSGLAKTQKGPEADASMVKTYESFQKAIELKPDDASYINNYALALARGKKFAEAQQELEKAATLDPTGAGKYFYNLGALLTNANQSEAAGAAFKRAIESDPEYADAQYQYGIYLTGKAKTKADGNLEFPPGTGEAFQKYVALKPDGPFAESAKGMLQAIGQKIDTSYQNPAAKKGAPAAKPPAPKKK